MKYVIFQASRKGGRAYNQDRVGYVYTSDSLLMVLCDGMGGHSRGDIAAQLTVEVASALFQARAKPKLLDSANFLLDAIYAAHDAINEYAANNRMPEPPRTTVVACVVQDNQACWAHVGDSRLYHFNRHGFLTRTRDHSAVQQLVDEGVIDERDMATHPDRNKLYNSVGGYSLPDIELSQPVTVHAGDVLFMCTDGVWPELTPEEVFATLRAYPLEKAVKNMMDHAEYRGGVDGDNLSVLALRFGEERFSSSELIPEDDFSIDGFTTQLNKLAARDLPVVSEMDLDEALAEIKAAIAGGDFAQNEKSARSAKPATPPKPGASG